MNPELEVIRTEIKEVKEHSETWNMLKYQSAQACKERFRQWVLIAILIILLAVCNLAWLYAWTQYDYVDLDATQDGTGVNIVGAGDIDYGAEGTSES